MKKIDENKIEVEDLPRKGSTLYNLLKADDYTRNKMLKRWKKMNKYFILPFYKIGLLPLFGFGKVFLILTTKGRKSGKMRKTPIEYRKKDGVITIVSARGEKSDWLQNLRANPDETRVRRGFHRFKPHLEFIDDFEEKESFIKYYVINHGRAAKMLFGWNPKTDDPDTKDFSTLLNSVTIICLHE